MRTALLAVVPLAIGLPLAACDGHDAGTTISIAGNSSGQVKVDLPGFQGTFKLPKIQLTADNFDLNGVHLPPGSKISGFNVDAGRKDDDGRVRIAFDSPMGAEAVRGWFAERLPKAGFAVRADGAGLVGTTDDKKPFALRLGETGAERATGTITIG
jgi:hypothetical protein